MGIDDEIVQWNKDNPRKHRDLRSVYGLSTEEIARIKERQGGVCAICKLDRELRLDHDHEAGRIRGLLCWYCSVTLWHFKDDPALFAAAAAYLTS